MGWLLPEARKSLDPRGRRAAVSQVSLYDCGERTLPRQVLERAADECGFPQALLDPAKRAIRSFRAAARVWSRAERVLAETFFTELLELGASALEVVLSPETEADVARSEDPETLADLLRRLERRSPRQRLVMVEEIEEFQSPALCELVMAKSRELEPDNPAEASEWAELARRWNWCLAFVEVKLVALHPFGADGAGAQIF